MRRIKRPKIGECVLLTEYHTFKPYHAFSIGAISKILETECGMYYQVEGRDVYFNYCFRITEAEKQNLICTYGDSRRSSRSW